MFKDRKLIFSIAALAGTMVGVGIFGIPFSFAKAGFGLGLAFMAGVVLITILLDLMYGEIVLRTRELHQMVGYANFYLGPFFKRIIFFSITFGFYAALLAYVIIAGDFLNNIFSVFFYVSKDGYSLIFYAVLSVLLLLGIKRISWLELGLMVLFVAVVAVIFVAGAGQIKAENVMNFFSESKEFWFLPYGILLFAFAGLPSVPIQRQLLEGEESRLKKSILTAVGIVAVLYLVFTLTVVGVAGDATTPDVVNGLFEAFGAKVLYLISVMGLLAVSTSFLMLGSAMSDIFRLDYGMGRLVSWLLVILPPLALFLAGVRQFINVIGIAGSLALGLEAAVLIMVFLKAKKASTRIPEYSLNIPRWIFYLLMVIFLAGIIYGTFFNSF